MSGSRGHYATRAGIRTSARSSPPPGWTFTAERNAPLPTALPFLGGGPSHGFGDSLSPVTLSAPDHSTSELLRTLSRVAASEPTSWLSGPSDRLSHYSEHLGTLAGGLGCFPLDDESSHPPSHFPDRLPAFAVWLESVSAKPPRPSSALPPAARYPRAEPQSISGRTSYLRVRLAFHPYPQLIRAILQH